MNASIDTQSKSLWRWMVVCNGVILLRFCTSHMEANRALNEFMRHGVIALADDYEIIRYAMPNPNYQGPPKELMEVFRQ